MLRWRGRWCTWSRELAWICAVHLLDTPDLCMPLVKMQAETFEICIRWLVGANKPGAGERVLVLTGVDPILW